MHSLTFRALVPALALSLAATPAHARPISYAGGWMFMNLNDPWTNSVSMVYSPTATTAVGPFFDYYHGRANGELAGLQFNWLPKRWNNPDSQANLYLLSGLGVANHDGDAHLGGYIGTEADWESRRYYTAYEARYTDAGKSVKEEFQQKGRIGFAPYIAESGSLHTWLILEADHFPEDNHPWTVIPTVRLFKGQYWAEAGISNRGRPLFNLMITF
jgi:hypothetical protein